MIRRFIAWLGFLAALCLVGEAATIVGPIYQTYSNRPYSGPILMRPLSTPQANTPNLLTGGDFIVRTDTNGLFSVDLQPGNYRVTVGADRAFTIDVPTNAATYTLLERITNALSWNSSIVPATNSYQLALTTRSGVVKTTSDQADPVAWLTNDTATIGRWLGSVTAGTIDELIATSAPDYDVDNIVVNGWVTEQDGRGGDWWYDYGATTTTNTGMVVAWGSGRLLRKWETEIRPQWFGADDNGSTDAAPALQAALNFASRPSYGWQASVGDNAASGYAGTFTVKANGSFALYSEVEIPGGVILEGKPGATWGEKTGHTFFWVHHGGSGFVINLYDLSQGYRIGGIKHVIMMGDSEIYQPNKKSITDIVDRLTFKVLDADAPPTLDDVTVRPGNNTCFFYDDQGEYLGSARITSTSSSGGKTTVVLHNGSDSFSSINGTAGDALTTACKVVWPVRVTDEFTAVSPAFNDPSLSGTVGVNIRNKRTGVAIGAGTPVLEDITTWRFHTGFRFGPGVSGSLSPMRDLRATRSKFAGFACARPENAADFIFTGSTYAAGFYEADYNRTLTSSSFISVTAATPAVFTKVGHGFTAGSLIRFGATTIPTGLTAGATYYVQSTGLTTDTFQVSTVYSGGSSVATTTTGTGLYIAGNVIDLPSMQWSTYGFYGIPNHARVDNGIFEFSAFAGVYAFRTISPSFRYLFLDGVMRHGMVINAGYADYSAPGSLEFSNWIGVDHMDVQPSFSIYPYDNYHTNRTIAYFEPTSSTRFAAIAIGNLNTQFPVGAQKFTHAFDLQHSSYNNRVKVGKLMDENAYTTWFNATGKAPEIDTPNMSNATDVSTGWYTPSFTQRDFAVSGTRLMSLTSGNVLIEKSNGSQLFTLKNTGNSNTFTVNVGTGSASFDNTYDSTRFGLMYSDSSIASFNIGSSAQSGTVRASLLKAETAAAGATDKAAGILYIYGSAGTGNSTTGGDIQFLTADAGSSGTTVQSHTAKVRLPRVGGVYLPGISSDPTATSSGHYYYNSTTKNFRFYDGSYWQPLSLQADERNVASASTVSLGAQDSDKVYITGTTTIDSFGSALAGTRRNVRFQGALTLTYNATSMVLPTGASITTAAGDTLEAVCISTGNWRVIWYQRASGHALAGGGGGGGGSGDVVGPSSATDNAVVRFDGSTGKLVQNSAVTIADTSGDITAGKYNGLTISSSTGTLTVSNGKTLSAANTVTLSGTDGSTITFGGGGTVAYTANNLSVFASTSSSQLAGVLSNESGTGLAVFNDGATLTNSTLNGLTFTGTAGSTLNVGTGGTLGTAAYTASTAYQPVDTDLTAIAGLTSAADKGIQFTGSGTAATYDLTTAGKALLDDADASAQRTTLGLGTVATESTVPVDKGGTGATSLTAYAPVFGGTTGTGAVQSGTVGTAGQVLTSNGSGALPTFQTPSGGGGSVATDSIFTTNGDLAVGTGSSTAARLGAGDYGAALTANGAAASLFYATPNNAVNITEHFLSHLASHTIFTEAFSSVSSTSGVGNDKDHPGVFSLSTGASASATGYMRVGNSSGTMMIGGGVIVYEQVVRIPNLSDTNQTFTAHFGFSEGSYGASFSGNHHIKFIHDNTSTNWQTSVKNGGTTTSSTSSTAVSTGWTKLRIVVNADRTSVAFFVNGTELSSSPITTNIPDNTDAMTFGWGITKSAGTTARTIDTDYVFFYQKLTNPL